MPRSMLETLRLHSVRQNVNGAAVLQFDDLKNEPPSNFETMTVLWTSTDYYYDVRLENSRISGYICRSTFGQFLIADFGGASFRSV